MAEHVYSLPPLAYNLSDLEPTISTQIMTLHYTKHHQTYITNLNNALKSQSQAVASTNLLKQLELQQSIKFNAGGHINHTLFWESLHPPRQSNSTTETISSAAPLLHASLLHKWGSIPNFKTQFETIALGLQGSGWVWLVRDVQSDASGAFSLSITTSKDQDVVPADKIPVLGIDMWEHAYYLQYLNNKKGYLEGMWDVVAWEVAEKRFGTRDVKEVFGALSGLAAKM